MELRNLRTFKAIAEEGSFARAAAVLGYTQSTVTVHVQQLERDLGVKLFERSGRAMVLTDMGQQVLEGATTLLDLSEQLEESCKEDILGGTLKIAAAETILCYLLGSAMGRFRKDAPSVSFKMYEKTCSQMPAAVMNGLCDLGYTYHELWDHDRFDVERLCSVPLVPVAAPEHAALDLAMGNQTIDLPLIVDEPDSVVRSISERYLEERGIVCEEAIEMWSVQALKCCVSMGMGFSILPEFVVRDDIDQGLLVPLRWDPDRDAVSIYCARKRTHRTTASMGLFARIVEDVIGENTALRPVDDNSSLGMEKRGHC